MTEQMSALLDGELAGLDQAGLRAALKCLCEDSNLRCDWALAHLVGDHLRGQGALKVDFARRLRERLAAETTVVMPGSLTSRHAPLWLALSVAASVLGVAVVCWVVLAINSPQAFEVAIAPQSLPTASGGSVGEAQPRRRSWRPSLVNSLRQP
ncbi:sigma-E factor negative regulatory protein [Accumulibacter sp.]|uniref:sigma-E factor negative regulatory protein n=1 Tax=Accumulibacter sp. TaxID=2053492 RepID=UPI00261BDBB0|nr:sigma-E factor negative regulatory protein [Accumulibacter sp.]